MKKLLIILLLIAHALQTAGVSAQTGIILAADRQGNDTTKWLNIKEGVENASANSIALNAAIRDTAKKKYNFSFPAGDYYFGEDASNTDINGTCVLVPDFAVGHCFVGKGLGSSGSIGQSFTKPSVQFFYAGPNLDLSTLTLSVANGSEFVTVSSGYTVKTQNTGATVNITGGTNAVTGFYTIATGPQLVTNGTFTGSATGWTLAGGAAYNVNNVRTTTGAGTVSQDTAGTDGILYTVTYAITASGGGTVTPSVGGTAGVQRTASGVYTEDIRCGATANAPLVFTFGGGGSGTVSIDNVRIGIAAVDVTNGQWHLDRTPTSGGAISALTGAMQYSLWKDQSNGPAYKGIGFRGNTTSGGAHAFVGFHKAPNDQSFNDGKALFEFCLFADFEAAVLCGRDMRGAFNTIPLASYDGESDNHCDHFLMLKPWFQYCRADLLMRNNQSVQHHLIDVRHYGHAANRSYVVYAERGGIVKVDGGTCSGPDVTCLLLGKNGTNVGQFLFIGVSYDGDSSGFKWLQNNTTVFNPNRVKFDTCYIKEATSSWSVPLWQATGATKLTIDNCYPVRTDSIEVKTHVSGSLTWTPNVSILNSQLDNFGSQPTNVYDVFNTATSDGTVFDSHANSNQLGTVAYPNGKWIKTTGTWVEQ